MEPRLLDPMPLQPRRREFSIVARVGLFSCSALVAISCAGDPVQQLGIPGTRADAQLELIARRGDHYLDALVTTGGRSWRFFLPASEDCEKLLQQQDGVRYTQQGALGSLQADDLRCDPIGVLSLRAWRDRVARPRSSTIPRGQARYEIFYRDQDLALARGRFPLIGFVGWTGGDDAVAVIPEVEECREAIDRTVSSIEYRATGSVPLALLVSGGRCPLLGLAHPPR